MKIRYISRLAFLILFLLSLGACESDFEQINRDPNNPTSVPTAYLLSSAQQSLIKEVYGMGTTSGWDATGMRYMQMWSSTLYTEIDRYVDIEGDFTLFYKGGLADLTEYIRLNTDEATRVAAAASGANQNQIAVARIMKAWTFQMITDIWGDIPYSQALKGLSYATPVYDAQADIYADLIKELDEATAQIDESAGSIEGDIIYDGDMASWKRFAQSLKLRVGMRMSEVAPELAAKTVQEALAAGVFASNSEQAGFQYLSSQPNFSHWYYTHFIGTPTLSVANTMIDKLLGNNDPRLQAYAREKENGGGYVGIPYGVSAAVAGSIGNRNVSSPGIRIISADARMVIQSYAEVLFIQAEAAARGWIGGNAEELYKAAITASMEYWDASPAAITAYLQQPGVAFDAANFRKSIGEQKWLALYMQGLEAWAEWRRLDYPALLPAPAAANGRQIPRRRGYPLQEVSLNRANYDAAVARQGPDVMETRVWWDK
jgi:hypothetical protein